MASTTTTQSTPDALQTLGSSADLQWRLHVMATPDRARVRTSLCLQEGRTELGREGCIAIEDSLLSRRHLSLTLAGGRVRVEDCGSRNGTFQAGRRIQEAWLGHGAVLRFGSTIMVLEADLGRAVEFADPTDDVPGRSELARMLRAELDLAGRSRLPALLIGETGSGKEHAALEMHRRGGRPGPFVRFNVAAVSEPLFESELFGHVAGAFTGASAARLGRIREAAGGTLVLDEIGELPEAMQPKLLRLLEEGVVRPVGGHSDLRVDVRFVASTNANLDSLVRDGRFRRDLLARLRGSEVLLPRLADRPTDVLDLADAVAPEPGRPWRERLTAEATELLLLHPWPDNLRALRAALVRANLLAGHGLVGREHLPDALRALRQPAPEPSAAPPGNRPSAPQLRVWLDEHGGNVDAIARKVGRHRRQIYRWLQYAGLGQPELDASRQGPVATLPEPATPRSK